MNILYISHLTNAISQGPNYSVPAQILAQSKIDNVFWWNLTNAFQDHWSEGNFFHGPEVSSSKRIEGLPKPFNNPDLVVFEDFYYLDDAIISWECRRRGIPYIVVPRGALTAYGQKRKPIKKAVGNALLFRGMTRGAAGIQFLTEEEKVNSGSKWNRNSCVVPNGVNLTLREGEKKVFRGLKGIYIGRFDPEQKGLDMLLEAVSANRAVLRANNLTITLHGPERLGCRERFSNQIDECNLTDILVVGDGVFGPQKKDALQEADFFIMTSRFEGMPMSMIEGASFGLPCLATDGTNMARFIEKYDAGWLLGATPETIGAGLCRMIREKALFPEKSKGALAFAKSLEWSKIAQVSHDFYEQCVR